MRKHIFNLIKGANEEQRWSYHFDYFITILIILNVIVIVLESYQHLYVKYEELFFVFEVFTVVVFSAEYILRLATSDLLYPEKSKFKALFRYMISTAAVIDLLAILPFYLPFLVNVDLRFIRALRLVRLLRILKLSRYSKSIKLIGKVLKETKSDLAVTIFICVILIILSSTLMYHIEREAQPEQFKNIGNAIWWAIATLTTVGYGDIYPITAWGKLISGLIAVLGIGLIALPTGIISSAFVEKLAERKERATKVSKKNFQYCPHCGEKLN